MSTGLVLVSHSAMLAAGVAELAAQMAPDVVIRPAGGTDDARLGTSFAVVERAVAAVLDAGCDGVVVLADIGSARMTAESVLESLEDARVRLAPGAFVEGAVAAAVAAQTGGGPADVGAAVRAATRQLGLEMEEAAADANEGTPPAAVAAPAEARNGVVQRRTTLRNPLGLHARPAAHLARLAGSFDATVRVNGVDAASLLALMGLGLTGGAEIVVEADGPQAEDAVEAVAGEIDTGFGEV
ncbi:dihydroxyacetone kinase, phosphotransfer subunit [Beutenbergia cavernae DSM 12333]|uniref:Phosphocarrier protein HPr n=1 Tax=Beutenbergia cavernae (strain ATCC BAA-8 / DSM 12333 / CCUG 43141 / JCM 11478 / NBRC 16432 / NCIMB 13614 / HKI 0122) TaxID=471853 RepID=C5BWZ2_BEUC1|nr:dihydroxyacetone kinase phosphoryl donor subunit DhaM [Beutenbergia cavernae]ACQ80808.1 dihydroxyacetone kinase, phosphotransfer subunit [Beutenbergia cavernae DSM 12333]